MDSGKSITKTFSTIANRRDFLAANAAGRRFICNSFILQMNKRNALHPAPEAPRFGFTVTKKMGNAVARNRIKRRLREALREAGLKYAVPGHDYVLISRHKGLNCPYAELLRDMEFAFSRISVMKNDKQNKSPAT